MVDWEIWTLFIALLQIFHILTWHLSNETFSTFSVDFISFCLAHVIIQVVRVCTANLNLLCAFLQPISIWGGQPCLTVWLWATGVVVFLTERSCSESVAQEKWKGLWKCERNQHIKSTHSFCFYFLHMYRYKIPCLKFLVFLFLLFSLFS